MRQQLSRKELWSENARFYGELISKYHFEQGPMLDLFLQLERAGFFEKYYPSNSHEALGISTEEFYSKRVNKPMVYITYIPVEHIFVVLYQKGQGNTILEENCGSIIFLEVLIKIEQWLNAD